MSFYDEIADYYDFIFPFNKAQTAFIKSCAEEPYRDKTILDIGCGTGDLAISLSAMGFHVVGIDYDAVMLKKAWKKSETGTSVTFDRMDMRDIGRSFSASSFDLVLCFGNTLVHLNSVQDIETFCKQVKTVLKERGTFLLQILNYDHILDHNIRKLPLIENDVVTFERYYEHDDKTNLIAFKTLLTVKEAKREIKNEIYLYPMRKHELDEALRNAGFTEVAYYADFDKSELKADSLPLVAEAS